MREGKKKTVTKKKVETIFGKGKEGDEIKKNIGQIYRKGNEGRRNKITFDLFEKKVMRATKKTSKKNCWKNVFYLFLKTCFLRNVFVSPKINWVFFENRQQSNALAGQKENTCFFW